MRRVRGDEEYVTDILGEIEKVAAGHVAQAIPQTRPAVA